MVLVAAIDIIIISIAATKTRILEWLTIYSCPRANCDDNALAL